MTTPTHNWFSFWREGSSLPRKRYLLPGIGGALFALWLVGFAFFVSDTFYNYVSLSTPSHGGIAVFTGAGGNRVWIGMDALNRGAGNRLLISGVNRDVDRGALRELVDDPNDLFECCVDLDYIAQNTWQNARETAAWAARNEFSNITLVTARYHEKRSLALLRHHMPGASIVSYHQTEMGTAVGEIDPLNFRTLRILAWEYTKYELALARIRIARLFGQRP